MSVGAYTPICVAPCTTSLPLGTQRIGVVLPDGKVIEPTSPVTITGPGSLEAHYKSRAGVRAAGLGTFVIGGLVGAGMIYASGADLSDECTQDGMCKGGETDRSLFGAGVGVIAGATIFGLALMLTGDTTSITFVPGTPAPLAGFGMSREGQFATAGASGDPRGAGIRVRF
jgi:hypothetical protein